ncbi:MAG: isoleucine--tRNA ligase [Synergistaceae bacterium]|nr:isoleucine--tRNA ligase [Synergistaceae bacterium]
MSDTERDYKDTLNLPATNFPMRANLAKREPGFLKFWQENDIYHKAIASRRDGERFVLHDGPPYANGDIHIGTAFNKILKDFIPKFKTMTGRYAPYVPGWDTHGLPIELRSLRDGGLSKLGTGVDPIELRKRCKATALHYLDVQREEFKRLGVLGEWDNPYITLDPRFEHLELHAFADMVEKGLIYRGLKPVYWCTDCQTALAAGEIEYWDESSPSVYVAYPMPKAAEKFSQLAGKDVYVVIWTTTPWTLPSSAGVSVHPRYDYGFYETGGKVYLLAVEMRASVREATGLDLGEPLFTVRGAELERLTAIHPFYDDKEVLLMLADYVELGTGTGCVHTSPGHGVEDYETGVRYGLEVYSSVDHAGHFEREMPIVGGMSLDEGGKKALSLIEERGRLLGLGKLMHSYPHCWRCKKPVIFRATDQWFINVSQFKDDALKAIDDEVKWIPDWGRDRIYNMVSSRSDWCISRQRVWGVPVPALRCKDCGAFTLTADRVRLLAEKVKDAPDGSSLWWSESLESLFGELAKCDHCGSHNVEKDSNILDVWFDSGVSHMSVLNERFGLSWPCEMYLEGSDQHRGWFQSSLLTAVAIKGHAPYHQVLTHGFILDGEGRKMSKSLGNTVAPQEVIDQYGAEILRLWVASTDYRNDVRISMTIIRSLSETYRRIRNTARFLLGNLHDFKPGENAVPYDKMLSMDRWILNRLHRVIGKARDAFEEYEFHVPTSAIHSLCVNELSAFYLDVSKDRLYTEGVDSLTRRSAQTAMWEVLSALTRMLAPILSFTAEEIWQEMRTIDAALPESVFLSDFPVQDKSKIDDGLDALWEEALTLRGAVSRMLEGLRAAKTIGTSLEAAVQVKKSESLKRVIDAFTPEELADICIVSQFEWSDAPSLETRFTDEETGLELAAGRARGTKCPRCWKYTEHAHEDGLCPRCAAVMSGKK